MAFDDRSLEDYIDVPQRIADFRTLYPKGGLREVRPWELVTVQNPWCRQCIGRRSVKQAGSWKTCPRCTGTGLRGEDEPPYDMFVSYTAAAYRAPDDPAPGIGCAWEAYPGQTPYTAGSELMNAETSAWGRAIVAALASDAKRGVSSREEVRNRAAENGHGDHGGPAFPVTARDMNLIPQRPGADMWDEVRAEERPGSALPADIAAIQRAYSKLGFDTRTDRDKVLGVTAQLVGRDPNGPTKGLSHKNLTFHEAKKLREKLDGFKGDRAALEARLTGMDEKAAQDAAAEATQEVLT